MVFCRVKLLLAHSIYITTYKLFLAMIKKKLKTYYLKNILT